MQRFFFILLFLPVVASAQQWIENGAPSKNHEYQGSKNGFGAMIVMTTNSKKALENWSKPTKGVYIPYAQLVEKGKPIEVLVFFSGCKPNRAGNCVAEADYKILKPDGSVYAQYTQTELWKNKPPIPEGKLGLAVDRIGLVADPDDPIGIYKVICTIRDRVGNFQFAVSTKFEVLDAKDSPMNK